MAPKAKCAELSSLDVTKEEIVKATEILAAADKKKTASLKAGMKHFCVANPDASLDNAKATGDKDFVGKTLRNFVIHQIRCKETEKSTTTDHTVTKSTAKVKQYRWWSEEVMD